MHAILNFSLTFEWLLTFVKSDLRPKKCSTKKIVTYSKKSRFCSLSRLKIVSVTHVCESYCSVYSCYVTNSHWCNVRICQAEKRHISSFFHSDCFKQVNFVFPQTIFNRDISISIASKIIAFGSEIPVMICNHSYFIHRTLVSACIMNFSRALHKCKWTKTVVFKVTVSLQVAVPSTWTIA